MGQMLKPLRVLIFAGLVIAFGFGLLISALMQSRLASQVSVNMTATILDRHVVQRDDASDQYQVSYQFDASDTQYRRQVSLGFYQTHPQGTDFTIKTHPDKPTIHNLYPGELSQKADETWRMGMVIASVGGIIFLLNGWRTFYKLRGRKQQDWPDV